MPLIDDIVLDFKAQAGQPQPTDLINGDTITAVGGSLALMSDADGDFWRLTGGDAVGNLGAARCAYGANTGLTDTVIVYQFRLSARAANYNIFMHLGDDANNGMLVSNSGSSSGSLRTRYLSSGTAINTTYPSYTTGTLVTLVQHFRMDGGGSGDFNAHWIGGATHVADTPDGISTSSIAGSGKNLDYVRLLVSTETLDLYRLTVLSGSTVSAMSHDDCAALADDPGAFLDSGGTPTTDVTIAANTGNATFSGTSYPQPKTIIAALLDNAVFSGTTDAGSAPVTQSSIAALLGNAVFAGTSYPQPTTIIAATLASATFSGVTSVSGTGTITSLVMRDLTTKSIRANETGITVFVNDETTGELVVKLTGQTSNSSGINVVSDVSIIPGTIYSVRKKFADGAQGTSTYTAA